MRRKDRDLESLHDIRALRLLVDDVKDCYAAHLSEDAVDVLRPARYVRLDTGYFKLGRELALDGLDERLAFPALLV
ncbi:MAG: hypothetical protein QNJ05_12635 [Woeseiaceae bacterium]|nr:hypothetical protein [Woeseiaceae bacterium]